MSFNIKKIGTSYKINYSGGKFRPVNINKLPNKTILQSLDRVYLGQPFVNVVSKFQDTRGLDIVYNGQPFYGHTDSIAIPTSQISTINHPDVTNWLNTVALNGGSASSSTIAALNTFCNSIDSAGLRNRFHRLNLFCGNNLNSCLVPLYVNTQSNSPALGFSIDANNNFVSGDYNETGSSGGLLGNGGGKYLRAGFSPASVGGTTGHYSAYARSINSDNTLQRLMGSDANYFAYMFAGSLLGHWGSATPVSSSASAGTMLFQRESNILMRYYANGSLQATETSSTSPQSSTSQYTVFTDGSFLSPGQGWYTRLGGYSIGLNMTAAQVSQFHSILQVFQTALNRNV
jgi:hypothetical protein